MKILVTGFDPFGGETVNPAYEAVKLLPDTIAGAQIIKLQVPTRFALSCTVLEAAVNEHRPDAVICVGQAGGRSAITPERVAINLADASIPDNAGDQPVDEPIRKDGAPAYFTSLPVKAMVQKMRAAGIPAALSYTAGSFVCNSLMYTLLSISSTGSIPLCGAALSMCRMRWSRPSASRWEHPAWSCIKSRAALHLR